MLNPRLTPWATILPPLQGYPGVRVARATDPRSPTPDPYSVLLNLFTRVEVK